MIDEKINQRTLDRCLADGIKDKLVMLRSAIEDAQSEGLTVEVPDLLQLYLTHGTASGAYRDWKITRRL